MPRPCDGCSYFFHTKMGLGRVRGNVVVMDKSGVMCTKTIRPKMPPNLSRKAEYMVWYTRKLCIAKLVVSFWSAYFLWKVNSRAFTIFICSSSIFLQIF